ncbi:phasin family protein [Marinobacterium rhizophilum]|uniref:Phasin family protein n=1 Tax=Marinobacterium rhizophilum TaxID=420402 RepID=A0ABY5HLM1_9GAMM|nr:phasin family protein [Marinobacterium rhizophilum]UTW13195.1 phasin family protein [Marinobacterium rhizophilum]
MYNDMMKDLKDKMQPVVDITEINKKAAEKLFALQSACVTDLFNSSIAQMKALTAVKEPKSAVELQVQFYKALESKLTDVAEQEIATLTEAKDQLSEIVEKSISDLSEMPTSNYFGDFSKFADFSKFTDMSQFADFSKFTDFSKFADLSAFTAAPVVEEAEKKAPAKAAPRKAAAPAATTAA